MLRRLWHRLLGHGSTVIGMRLEWQGDAITWTNSNVCRTCQPASGYLYLDSTDF